MMGVDLTFRGTMAEKALSLEPTSRSSLTNGVCSMPLLLEWLRQTNPIGVRWLLRIHHLKSVGIAGGSAGKYCFDCPGFLRGTVDTMGKKS